MTAGDAEIRTILARLAHLADAGEIDQYLSLFTDDAVWRMPANPGIGLEASERRGVDAIAAGVRERRQAGVQGPGTATKHLVTTTAVRLDGPDTAVAESYWIFLVDTTSAPRIQSTGRYEDTFRRTDDGWRLAVRSIELG